MNIQSRSGRAFLYFLIFLSGASGLIYQVVWHKYLSILLGAQARATAVVLAIFLGGISWGYHTFGGWTRRKPWNLLLVYSMVELGLAFWALCFPYFFRFFFQHVPELLNSFGVTSLTFDILISVVLIGVPTFLMGGTLPLLTQGLSDSFQEASSTHAKIYGFNTLGACFGSLLAGYFLIPILDLPSTVSIGGIINLFVAFATYFAFAKFSEKNPVASQEELAKRMNFARGDLLILGVGFLSGFYTLALETVLIRLVGLSTGSSNYNFTLIVSIFVFALGIGSLAVRRISQYTSQRLFWNQLGVSGFLFLLYLAGDRLPYWVHLIRIVFRDTIPNFYLYQFTLGVAFFVLLAIPIGLCGLALPLCFHLLKDRKETLGYRVGQLYGLNTLGCVAGALIGGYLFLNYFNLDELFKICITLALISVVLSAWYVLEKERPTLRIAALGSAIFSMVVIATLVAPLYTKERYLQPFRQQHPLAVSYDGLDAFTEFLGGSTRYLFYKDGPNTSIGIGITPREGKEFSRTVFVNGKSDGNTRGDFFTMSMTGHIPALFARKLDRACVIGMGTGITVGNLASYHQSKTIDVVEIADTLIHSRNFFDLYNGEVSKNTKVNIHAMDAFRFLGGTKEKFDVIVSEPSNPWVAGVENLYTKEFYQTAKSKLNPDGIYLQWVQSYSFNDKLLQKVLKTITSEFKYVHVFQMLEFDLALVATNQAITREDLLRAKARLENEPKAKQSFLSGGLNRFESFLALELVPASLTPVLGADAEPLHLESPRLSHGAAKAFFLSSMADVPKMRREWKEFYPSVGTDLLSVYLEGKLPSLSLIEDLRSSFCSEHPSRNRRLCSEATVMAGWLNPSSSELTFVSGEAPPLEIRSLASIAGNEGLKLKKAFTDRDFMVQKRTFDYYKKFYSGIARLPIRPLLNEMDRCLETTALDSELRGDCLLHKAVVLEVLQPDEKMFLDIFQKYGQWFATQKPDSPSYPRFKRAFEVFDKVLNEVTSKSLRG